MIAIFSWGTKSPQRGWSRARTPLPLALLLMLSAFVGFQATGSERSFRECADCPEMRPIPAGRFIMGAPESDSQNRRFGWGGPPAEVRIRRAFAMSRTEITRGQFAAFVAATGYAPDGRCRSIWEKRLAPDARPSWRDPLWPDGSAATDSHPAVCIGFSDAQAYANWLTRQAGGKRVYGLPSEAQWEYAARAGSRTPRYWDAPTAAAVPSGGALAAAARGATAARDAATTTDDVCRHANVGDRRYHALFPEFPTFDCDDGYAFTAPVGSFPANGFGLQDMLGNAWEWVADCVTPDLSRHPRDGRAADIAVPGADCTRRVMRGAGFPSADFYVRASTRGGDPAPATRLVVIGFRVVSEPARSR